MLTQLVYYKVKYIDLQYALLCVDLILNTRGYVFLGMAAK